MENQVLDQAIYDRYIVPTKRERTRKVGLEFELPILNRKKKPVDFQEVHRMTGQFIQAFQFSRISKDDDGFIYSAIDEKTGDGLSFDCSYNTLEFSFGTETDLNILFERFKRYYTYVHLTIH